MKKQIIILVLLLGVAIQTIGSKTPEVKTHSLSGSVIDNTNLETLIGASIYVVETGETFYTDFEGNFHLNIPEGVYTFKVSLVSYKEFEIKNLHITKNLELDLALHAK